MNKLFNCETLPASLSTSIIIPLVKSYKKPLKDPNNYRGISLTPIITKLMECIILNKCPQIKNHNSSQFGFASCSSTINAEILIQDTINYYNKANSPVYLCSLDAEKAFDCCNWLKLFQKLSTNQILPNTVIKTLTKLYLNGEAEVRYKNVYSSPFTLSQGVRQGSILSPYLYNFYTDELLSQVKALNIGTFLPNDTNTSIIAFADDIILISPTLTGLQSMLDNCVKYGREHGIRFNNKTQFVISGKSPFQDPKLVLNNVFIRPKDNLIHLGFEWKIKSNKLSLHKHKENQINKLWSSTASLVSAGIRKLHLYSIISIYQSVLIPQFLYGLEILNLSQNELEYINKQCRICLKSLLGVSKYSKNYVQHIFNLKDTSFIIAMRQVQQLHQSFRNKTLSSYFLNLLTLTDRKYSILNKLLDTCNQRYGSIVDIAVNDIKKEKLYTSYIKHPKDKDLADIEQCKLFLKHWQDLECRKSFRDLIQCEIRGKSENSNA